MKENKIRKTHTLDKRVYDEFQIYATCLGRSVSSLIEQYMRETLEESKKAIEEIEEETPSVDKLLNKQGDNYIPNNLEGRE